MEKIIIEKSGEELKVGELHTKKLYVLFEEVGTATLDNGIEISLQVNAISRLPYIRYKERTYILYWEDILNLAKINGLFDDDKEVQEDEQE